MSNEPTTMACCHRRHAKRGPESPEEDGTEDPDLPDADDEFLDRDRPGKIRCPKCLWRPRRSDRWQCRCGFAWNTFETQGICPDCGFIWHETQCPVCHEWSPHLEWYTDDEEAH